MNKWDERFLRIAKEVSTWSRDPSTKVGSVIVKDKIIIATGFNGFPQKMFDLDKWLENREEKYSRIIHAEMNAMIFCRQWVAGTTIYNFPFLSCDRCAVHLIQAGVIRFVAPKLDTEAAKRWEPMFEKTREYCLNCSVTCEEYNIEGIL